MVTGMDIVHCISRLWGLLLQQLSVNTGTGMDMLYLTTQGLLLNTGMDTGMAMGMDMGIGQLRVQQQSTATVTVML